MIRAILILTLFIFVLNLTYLFVSPHVKNTMLDGKMTDLAKDRANRSADEIHAEVMKFVYDKQIDLDDRQLMVEKTGNGFLIAARYETEVSFWNYTRNYEFFPASDERARMYWRKRDNRF